MIDITFNMFSDTPDGEDPDTWSPTLRKYHQILWSKQLPNGTVFNLDIGLTEAGSSDARLTLLPDDSLSVVSVISFI